MAFTSQSQAKYRFQPAAVATTKKESCETYSIQTLSLVQHMQERALKALNLTCSGVEDGEVMRAGGGNRIYLP